MSKTDRLDRQAVRSASKYMGKVAWTTVILGLLFAAVYVAVVGLALEGLVSLWIAVPLVAMVTYLSYTILHESVHGSITGNHKSLRWLNKVLGFVAAWITMIPLTAHRYEHIAHHRYANDEALDPDFHVGRMRDSLLAPLGAAFRAWVSQFSYYKKNRLSKAPAREKVQLGLEVTFALGLRLAIIVSGYWIEGLALFVLAWLIGAIGLLYLFAFIVHRPHEQVGRYRDTATILPPESAPLKSALNWFWLFQNYHSIHHLFPRVPFYKYAELYEEIEDVMEAKHAPIYKISIRGLKQVPSGIIA